MVTSDGDGISIPMGRPSSDQSTRKTFSMRLDPDTRIAGSTRQIEIRRQGPSLAVRDLKVTV